MFDNLLWSSLVLLQFTSCCTLRWMADGDRSFVSTIVPELATCPWTNKRPHMIIPHSDQHAGYPGCCRDLNGHQELPLDIGPSKMGGGVHLWFPLTRAKRVSNRNKNPKGTKMPGARDWDLLGVCGGSQHWLSGFCSSTQGPTAFSSMPKIPASTGSQQGWLQLRPGCSVRAVFVGPVTQLLVYPIISRDFIHPSGGPTPGPGGTLSQV